VLAPTGSEAPFKIVQLLVLVLFIALTVFAFKRFRGEPGHGVSHAWTDDPFWARVTPVRRGEKSLVRWP
jgi:hypothetical protein